VTDTGEGSTISGIAWTLSGRGSTMRLGIMQPYFLPYIGYFQLMHHCDAFVIYDDVQYTKKGWINRNRMLLNSTSAMFTIPLRSDSDYLDIRDRYVSEVYKPDILFKRFTQAYRNSPFWHECAPTFQEILEFPNRNLFNFVFNSVRKVAASLNITTEICVSSELEIEKTLTGQDRVIAICNAMNATEYINPIGGVKLYDQRSFKDNGIELRFLQSNLTNYSQGGNQFQSALSIVDVLAWCGFSATRRLLEEDFQILPLIETGYFNPCSQGITDSE